MTNKTFSPDILHVFDEKWAILTAGNGEQYNSMVIGWGALGTIWAKPAATVYVRLSRYTKEFMDNQNIFTLSFFDEKYKKAELVLGEKSGRDGDKIAESGLTPVQLGEGVTFKEAKTTLVCKKIYQQDMDFEHFPEIRERFYSGTDEGDIHVMYIGEVTDVVK